jgi:hypothetical protein
VDAGILAFRKHGTGKGGLHQRIAARQRRPATGRLVEGPIAQYFGHYLLCSNFSAHQEQTLRVAASDALPADGARVTMIDARLTGPRLCALGQTRTHSPHAMQRPG